MRPRGELECLSWLGRDSLSFLSSFCCPDLLFILSKVAEIGIRTPFWLLRSHQPRPIKSLVVFDGKGRRFFLSIPIRGDEENKQKQSRLF